MKKIITSSLIYFFFILFFTGFCLTGKSKDPKNKPWNSIHTTCPMFAFDNNGNPVFDLKKDELELFINGNPVSINSLKGCFDQDEKEPAAGPGKDLFGFIIIDSVFSSDAGFLYSREIVENIILGSKNFEKFIVFENHPIEGLKYIGGPETGSAELIRHINSMKIDIQKWSEQVLGKSLSEEDTDDDIESPFSEFKSIREVDSSRTEKEKALKKIKKEKFNAGFNRLKKLLESTFNPKIVFFISEGIPAGPFTDPLYPIKMENIIAVDRARKGNSGKGLGVWSVILDSERLSNFKTMFSMEMFETVKKITDIINRGSAILYTINPVMPGKDFKPEIPGELALRPVHFEALGRTFTGSDPADIVKKVKKNISPCYELSFTVPVLTGNNNSVKIRCKRGNVKVVSIQYFKQVKNKLKNEKKSE